MAANLSASAAAPEAAAAQERNVPALVFGVLLIVVIICGNLLVCLSVLTEKALKTTTNYFIVSLAVADLMLAVLVLPLFVYSEVRSAQTHGDQTLHEIFSKITTQKSKSGLLILPRMFTPVKRKSILITLF